MTRKTPFRYAPCGDSDGETIGTDHFVLDGAGEEIACPPDEATARLFAAAPDLLTACKAILAWADRECMPQGGKNDGPWEAVEAAIAKTEGNP